MLLPDTRNTVIRRVKAHGLSENNQVNSSTQHRPEAHQRRLRRSKLPIKLLIKTVPKTTQPVSGAWRCEIEI